MTDLTRKGQPMRVKWTEIQEHSFNSLKKALTMSPILKLPNASEMFILRIDASDQDIGSILLQAEVGVKCYQGKSDLRPLKKSVWHWSGLSKNFNDIFMASTLLWKQIISRYYI